MLILVVEFAPPWVISHSLSKFFAETQEITINSDIDKEKALQQF